MKSILGCGNRCIFRYLNQQNQQPISKKTIQSAYEHFEDSSHRHSELTCNKKENKETNSENRP